MNFRDYWQHKGGKFGRCHSHPESDFVWINIPKNASSWTQTFLSHEFLWYEHDYHESSSLHNKTCIICLRDPVARWISGIAEFFTLYHPHIDLAQMNNLSWTLLADRVAFDDHTEKQSLYLDGINLDNSVFFYVDHSFRQNWLHFFTKTRLLPTEYQVPSCVDKFLHDHSADSRQRSIYKFFQNLILQDHDFRTCIQNYYQIDYDLLKKTEFYSVDVV